MACPLANVAGAVPVLETVVVHTQALPRVVALPDVVAGRGGQVGSDDLDGVGALVVGLVGLDDDVVGIHRARPARARVHE